MADPWITAPTLGGDSTVYTLGHSVERRDAVAALAGQARRRVDVLTDDLEPAVYDQGPFLDALRGLAIASPRTAVRVLIGDSRRAVANGHRLIELARALTSSITLRRPGPETELGAETFLLVDDRGVVRRSTPDTTEASLCFNDPLGVRQLRARFDELWEQARPDPELRRLHL